MERMTTAQAAKELNINIVGLQVLMQTEKLPIGYAIKKPGSTRYTYIIYKELVEAYKRKVEQGDLC
jgi:hypothetical protein